MPGRRLIVCCDGTFQDGSGSGQPTNVVRLQSCIANIPRQCKFYIEGVGTNERLTLENGLKGLTGEGLPERIGRAYKWICHMCSWDEYERDEIYLIGFSRGACIARALAVLISDIGIMYPSTNDQSWPNIWEEWHRQRKDNSLWPATWTELHRAGHTRHRKVKIKVCAVFDTVNALYSSEGRSFWFLNDPKVEDSIENAIQALALQEHRHLFSPTVWQGYNQQQRLKQCWFLGHHSDVGGGKVGASNIALIWMITQIKKCSGLEFDETKVSDTLATVDLLKGGKFILKDSAWLPEGGDRIPGRYGKGVDLTNESVHWSVHTLQHQGLYKNKRSGLPSQQLALQGFEWDENRSSGPCWSNRRTNKHIPEQRVEAEEARLIRKWVSQFERSWFLPDHHLQSASSIPSQPVLASYAPTSSVSSSTQSPYSNPYQPVPVSYASTSYASPSTQSPYSSNTPATTGVLNNIGSPHYTTTTLSNESRHPIIVTSADLAAYGTQHPPQEVPAQDESYLDGNNGLLWSFGPRHETLRALDPVTGESLIAYYYSREDLKTWAFYRRNGDFVRIG